MFCLGCESPKCPGHPPNWNHWMARQTWYKGDAIWLSLGRCSGETVRHGMAEGAEKAALDSASAQRLDELEYSKLERMAANEHRVDRLEFISWAAQRWSDSQFGVPPEFAAATASIKQKVGVIADKHLLETIGLLSLLLKDKYGFSDARLGEELAELAAAKILDDAGDVHGLKSETLRKRLSKGREAIEIRKRNGR